MEIQVLFAHCNYWKHNKEWAKFIYTVCVPVHLCVYVREYVSMCVRVCVYGVQICVCPGVCVCYIFEIENSI